MRITVTGGAGFIGSHLVDRLIEDGHTVQVIDNLYTGNKEFVHSKAQFIELDIRDPKLYSVLEEFRPDYIFHEAAQTEVSTSMSNPMLDCDINLMGLINLLNAAVKLDVKKFLMPSSAAVYGNLDTLPLNEEMIGNPSSFYGLTKLTTEHYLRIYHEAFGLPYICYRYSNVFGPRQGNGGEGGVISIFAKAIVQGSPIIIYGDGKQTRDFIYVDDVVEANILGIQHQVTGIYNVSTGISSSVNLLVDEFRNISGKDIEVVYDKPRLGDIRDSVLATDKSEKKLLFTAKYNLHDGLIKTYEYFKTVEG
ncbi:MAG: NAD-dependent epimerase/dehydratase family protein [Veillonella parvula]|jgi:NAD-binding protein|uniref:NAD-dependent epimerase/dehydratase family protein n=1 Tax=Veillonella TaxID=29465 RepID=UPI001D3EB3DD|nr:MULTISPECIES: NAD-dependent epimerase/dehydratase family protein [Veillonella]MBS6748385.1 NAD-dependent epimerase/dehydratase family protein [Veillonella parvula]MDU3823239.1 NAD-dependent epimerase/dehydratase family protein [Veillonella sp.]MDU4966319.1 NAD-dependent epimerase/dehydratase family protein [Veillonella parvula]